MALTLIYCFRQPLAQCAMHRSRNQGRHDVQPSPLMTFPSSHSLLYGYLKAEYVASEEGKCAQGLNPSHRNMCDVSCIKSNLGKKQARS